MRRALALIGRSERRALRLFALANFLTGVLDGIAVIALVPLLSLLAGGAGATSAPPLLSRAYAGDDMPLILAGIAAGLLLLRSALAVLLLWLSSGVLARCTYNLSTEITGRYLEAPWLVAQSSGMGELVRNTSASASAVANSAIGSSLFFASDLGVITFVIMALLLADPLVAVSAMAYVGLVAFVYLEVVRRTVEAKGHQAQVETARVNDALFAMAGGLREIRIRGVGRRVQARYGDAYRRVLWANRVLGLLSSSTRYLLEAALIIGLVLIVVAGALTGGAQAALLSLGIVVVAGFRVLPAFTSMVNTVNAIRASSPAISLLEDELRRLPPRSSVQAIPEGGPGGTETPLLFEDLVLESVTFQYPTRPRPALCEVTTRITRGESVGVVGSSGAGKSTLVDIILGLLEPTSGSVLINGTPLGLRVGEWRGVLGFVPQDVYLLNDSVRSNIVFDGRLGAPRAEEARLKSVIDTVRLTQLLDELPDGLDTQVGERGANVSGGQAQRIGLARALYRRPQVLLLDEATSALDNVTEAEIEQALDQMRGSITMIVVAHRLSTVKRCDRILYFEDGSLAAEGSFHELRESSPGFRALVERGRLDT